MASMHPELAPIAFIAAFSLFLALPWHWRARNVATLSIIFWLFAINLIFAIDSVMWANSIDIMALVWCDITTKLIIGSNFALPAACLCICIHLEQVSSIRVVRTTVADKRRRQLFEAFMCFGLPLLFMALHYIVQGHRFDIIEEYGCRPATYLSVASVFIVWIPPILMAVAALVFAGLALRHFMLRRITFAAHLDATHSALTTSRYLRLMLMSIIQMIWSLSITSYILWFTLMAVPLRPWTSWADVHSNFSRVDTYPVAFIPEVVLTSYYAAWWVLPASTFIFVAFFAFGHEAVEDYKRCFGIVRDFVLRRKPAPASKGRFDPRGMELPSYEAKSAGASAKSSPLPAPPSSSKFRETLDESDYDSHSETSSHMGPALSYHGDANPIAVVIAALPPRSTSPQVASPRARSLTDSPPRPVTYPSFDAAHRGIHAPGAV
ncbi:pheromone A receptor-domain-containing protein [Mycena rosella]|uniref:Pheromone A receptor-domain-containing protein n=1 Tax=Mycena rosella TaxID=1033263 RepID=A0AAD7G5M9_MYCRO|nr:pheromone A receptor-domain-containing protein [Mycena rosella]